MLTFQHKRDKTFFNTIGKCFYSYVVENNGEVTDFCSFYFLPSSIIQHPKHKTLKAAYSFYNVANKNTLKALTVDMLVIAKKQGFDVFNALDIMDNQELFKDLKFGIGDGNLQYYLYNWKVTSLDANQIGMVLV